jgi:hypothetical protein
MINGSGLTLEDLENAVEKSLLNFGPSPLIMSPQNIQQLQQIYGFVVNPEFSGCPWERITRITKRERKVAQLHLLLLKLKILSNFSQEELDNLVYLSAKRLKRAKWARYNV